MADELDPGAGEWILACQQWANGIGLNWVASRPLGQGSFGITGSVRLAQGIPPEENEYAPHTSLVVKQTGEGRAPHHNGSAVREANIMKEFQDRCPHVVQLVAGPFWDFGRGDLTGSGRDFDRPHHMVQRYYMEFMPGGDLSGWRRRERKDAEGNVVPIEETKLWKLFLCLARGVLAMDTGSEDPQNRHFPKGKALCHFDIKFDNILVGGDNTLGADNPEHEDMPIFKMADFGLSDWIPYDVHDVTLGNWEKDHSGTGTPVWFPPEAEPNDLLADDKDGEHALYSGKEYVRRGPRGASNTWQIGWAMYHFLLDHEPAEERDFYDWPQRSIQSPRLARGKTFGVTQMNRRAPANTYSKELRKTIMECLMLDPNHRLPSTELVERIERVLRDRRGRAPRTTRPSHPPVSSGAGRGPRRSGLGSLTNKLKSSFKSIRSKFSRHHSQEIPNSPP